MPQSTHHRAAELHNLAAHAHSAAATAHAKGDHLTAHELSNRRLSTAETHTSTLKSWSRNARSPAGSKGQAHLRLEGMRAWRMSVAHLHTLLVRFKRPWVLHSWRDALHQVLPGLDHGASSERLQRFREQNCTACLPANRYSFHKARRVVTDTPKDSNGMHRLSFCIRHALQAVSPLNPKSSFASVTVATEMRHRDPFNEGAGDIVADISHAKDSRIERSGLRGSVEHLW